MKRIGLLFYRNVVILTSVLLVVAIAVPFNSTVLAATALSDDFNRCTYNTGFWTFQNPAAIPGAAPGIIGAFTGNSVLRMSVPAGKSYTISDANTNAPRIWHKIQDGNISYEAKFLAPMKELSVDSWKIMGILVRDNTQTPPKYFRFDFNSRNGGLNQYVGFLDDGGVLHHIFGPTGPADLPGGNPATGPLYLRVKYDKATTTWTVYYQIGSTTTYTVTESFKGSTYDPSFTLTDIGLFVGSTGANPPGNTMVVDYFRNVNDPGFSNPALADDNIKLTIQKLGTGTGMVNWPMTSPAQCTAGNVISLTATAAAGSIFAGWGGDITPTSSRTVSVTMNASKVLQATFNLSGQGLGDRIFMPSVLK